MHQEVHSFGTTTTQLLELADWLAEHDCTHVAMEATGVYWKSVWYVLEAEFAMPGVSDLTASVVVAEIGVDMSRFPSAGHLISWAGLCPRSDESAGKRRSTRVRKSGTWIKTTLVTAAWAAVRVKTSYLRAQFVRIKARRGAKKAILAVAASMLTAAYHMLRDGSEYNDPGADHFG